MTEIQRSLQILSGTTLDSQAAAALLAASIPDGLPAALDSLSTVATEVRDVFTGKSNGKPAAPDRGEDYQHYGGSKGEIAELRVVDGKLTIQASTAFPAAGYVNVPLEKTLRRIGGRFTLSSYSTASGAAAFLAWATPINSPTVPNSPLHLVIGATVAILSVYSGGVSTTVGSWTYDTPLTADGATVHQAEAFIDKEANTVYVVLPAAYRGQRVVSATHALIGSTTATYAGWEVFGLNTTDARAAFLDYWADSNDTNLAFLKAFHNMETLLPRQRPISTQYTGGDIAVPTSTTTTGITRSIIIPPSGRVLVSLSGFLAMTAPGDIVWIVRIGGTNKVFEYVVKGEQVNSKKQIMAEMSGTGMLTPGVLVTFEWFHACLAGGTIATLKASGGTYAANMTLIPLD